MSDARLRELERRWRETGAPADEVAWFEELERAGVLARRAGDLEAMVTREADEGHLRLSYGPERSGAVAVALDAFVERLGLRPLGAAWREVTAERARAILVQVLWRDLAYRAARMERSRAEELARGFAELFVSSRVRWFTNGRWSSGRDGALRFSSWNPLTQATFDSGVVAWDGARAGLLWVEDED